jgi:proteic killer suppression protein
MIKSFSHKGLEDFFYDGTKKGIQPKQADRLEEILDRLNQAKEIRDMAYPGSNLHLLLPKQERRWAVKVSGNWRITFVFQEGHAHEVNYGDYHWLHEREEGEPYERAQKTASSSWPGPEKPSLNSPVDFDHGFSKDPGDIAKDGVQNCKRARFDHSGYGFTAFPSFQYDAWSLVRPATGIWPLACHSWFQGMAKGEVRKPIRWNYRLEENLSNHPCPTFLKG